MQQASREAPLLRTPTTNTNHDAWIGLLDLAKVEVKGTLPKMKDDLFDKIRVGDCPAK